MRRRLTYIFLLALLGAGAVRAEVTFSLVILREVKPAYASGYGQTRYFVVPALSDTNPPASYHRVEGPAMFCSVNFGTNTDFATTWFNQPGPMLSAITNGDWTVWLNRETPEEQSYTFTLATSSIDTNALGQVVISAPLNGGINVSSNTPYLWTGPPDFDSINVSIANGTNETLAPTETSWPTGPALEPGTNFLAVTYFRDVTTNYDISTPTNETFGLLTNWAVSGINLLSSARAGFLTEGLAPSPLAAALDAPGMIWETGGATNWFAQSTNTTDGTDAAQSGVILDGESTTIRTVIYGTNTISFAWRTDAEDQADYVEFSDNGIYVTDLTGVTSWQQFTYHLTPGVVHVLEWTYHKDSSISEGADAAFLDQVRLGPNTLPAGPALQFSLTLRREQKSAHDPLWPDQLGFRAFPGLATTNPPASYHEVRSPNSWYVATVGPTNTSVTTTFTPDFSDMADELTNGTWALWLDRETPQEQFFTFTLSNLSVTSNDLTAVSIITPSNGSNGIPPHISYQWTGGLVAADELFVIAYQISNDLQFTYTSELLLPTATNWATGPLLAEGTNYFQVRSAQTSAPNYMVSAPFLGWFLGNSRAESITTSSFIVSNAAPVQLLNPQPAGGYFQFEFLSQPGFTNTIQSRTNLTLGDWMNRTNILGDGALKTVALPISSEPAEFFRVVTE